ncbi:anthranilate synthase component I [Bacillus cihuensis]|uniref:anthranilate synthase component I n=1 Tax=Bacillus cihuensis TaxID=1208599 RepID=UPI00040E75DD|nr:anthranilate synthase component I [Bacillus cihuensis]
MTSERRKLTFKKVTVEGDIHTPISIFRKLPGGKKFLLESSPSHHDNGRYSYIGFNPYLELVSIDKVTTRIGANQKKGIEIGALMDELKKELDVEFEVNDLDIPFFGGAVGYLGYDMIRQYEDIGDVPEDTLNMPDAHILLFEDVIVYDHLTEKIHLITSSSDYEVRLAALKKNIESATEKEPESERVHLDFQSNISQRTFENLVHQAKEAIVAGEVFQVVLSQRFQSPFHVDPFQAYRRLRLSNPSPYMFFIDFEEYTVLGSSPESLISVKDRQVTVNPIAGTRPRGSTPAEDLQYEQSLLQDEKELAEHKMLVDLGRNDLGRVCEIGSIKLTSQMKIERYKHVMHITSKIKGMLRSDLTSIDALIACMPAGTVSGAPKIRAMQIINELENVKRGVYAGSVGYLGFGGTLDMALAIRTMVIKDAVAYVQAGAGIVYDSVATTEYEETRNKAKALLEVQRDDITH